MIPRLALTCGEPSGIGPDVVLGAAMGEYPAELLAIGDVATLTSRAKALKLSIEFLPFTVGAQPRQHQPGQLPVIDIPLRANCIAGQLDPLNSRAVLATLELAVALCRDRECQAMVTAPIHKGVICDAGVPFSGHTEYLASACAADGAVMLLVSPTLRVALATTHLPLRQVPDAIRETSLKHTLTILHDAFAEQWGLGMPRITVLGLNPHAGEGGHLGTEEQEIIAPVLAELRAKGWQLTGPLPADTAFAAAVRKVTDVYLAMYHDQGLAVLKSESMGEAVNVTLGLPIIRTSVDHGVALDLAATGRADASSMKAAITLAAALTSGQATMP